MSVLESGIDRLVGVYAILQVPFSESQCCCWEVCLLEIDEKQKAMVLSRQPLDVRIKDLDDSEKTWSLVPELSLSGACPEQLVAYEPQAVSVTFQNADGSRFREYEASLRVLRA